MVEHNKERRRYEYLVSSSEHWWEGDEESKEGFCFYPKSCCITDNIHLYQVKQNDERKSFKVASAMRSIVSIVCIGNFEYGKRDGKSGL